MLLLPLFGTHLEHQYNSLEGEHVCLGPKTSCVKSCVNPTVAPYTVTTISRMIGTRQKILRKWGIPELFLGIRSHLQDLLVTVTITNHYSALGAFYANVVTTSIITTKGMTPLLLL